jgi:dephospho-CoA kinase
MDRVVVVTAPDDLKIARYVARLGVPAERRAMAEVDARSRLGHQVPDALKAARADYVVENTGDLHALELQVTRLWQWLQEQSNIPVKDGSLK